MVETILVRALTSGPKKFEAELPGGRRVRFGATGASDYTIHKDALRMVRYVVRHGGRKPNASPREIHEEMLNVKKSTKENWSPSGVGTAGFWSRWLLWSEPTLRAAVRRVNIVLEGKYKVIIKKA